MAPHVTTVTTLEEEIASKESQEKPLVPKGYKGVFGEYVTELKWMHIIIITLFHIVTAYLTWDFPWLQKLPTVAWIVVISVLAGFGVTAGAHRFWCHRAYKANLPLQILMACCFSAAGQNTIFDWVRDHRVHHKYSETDADPHNSNRGFFFAHMGWLYLKKHPEVIKRGRELDMSDITEDPLVKFHNTFFIPLKILFCFALPTVIPVYCWNETWYHAIVSQCFIRYMFTLHSTWSVNSAAHLFGYKPYDVKINPRENILVSFFAMGEGWHNYHHTFPWDYKASEYGRINPTLFLLNLFAKIGWAYDMKEPSDTLVKMVMERRGPHCHQPVHEVSETDDLCKKVS